MAYIEMQHCYKRYTSGETEIFANQDVSFEIEKGELVIILGASGAGKSTVLNILGSSLISTDLILASCMRITRSAIGARAPLWVTMTTVASLFSRHIL